MWGYPKEPEGDGYKMPANTDPNKTLQLVRKAQSIRKVPFIEMKVAVTVNGQPEMYVTRSVLN